MYVNEPVKTVGMMRKMTGIVPTNIGIRRNFMMPHNTEVGQSGPPIKIAHFEMPSPGSLRTSFIERISLVLIPTKERTFTDPANCSPISFCWHAQANNFKIRETAQQ
mmetsp:Transcript_5005/g.6897  ORF Transcript_5005/g.6897 Transcript_5005/m.6897 type:complete len:107 (+) Transcript_5005:948-1268(+)